MEQNAQRELREVSPEWTLGELMARIAKALVSDGPAGRGKLHLRIWTYKVWYWFGLVNYTLTREFWILKVCK